MLLACRRLAFSSRRLCTASSDHFSLLSLQRRFDLDELPQLINVLMGQMTLVGPRPMIPSEIIDFSSWQRKRFSMHPGMTGLWQVRHKLSDPFLVGLRTDLDYIDNWTLRLDLRILLETVGAVLRDRAR